MNAYQACVALNAIMESVKPSGTRVIYDNAVDDAEPLDVNERFIRHHVELGDGEQVSFGAPGSNRWRYPGMVMISTYGPLNQGDGEQMELCETIKNAHLGKSVAGTTLVLQAASVRTVGARDGRWQVNVYAPFYFDQLA